MLLARLHRLLNDETWPPGHVMSISLTVLILLNATAAVVETTPNLPDALRAALDWFERLSLAVFTVEYLARLLSCTSGGDGPRHPLWGRLHHVLSPLSLIDLAVLLPFYFATGVDTRTLRVVRLLRLLRLLRYDPYARSLRGFAIVLRQRRGELMLCGLLAFGMILVAATLMYYAERTVQPERMGSIPDCLWWAVIHLTTIGYGDVYPVTVTGKIIAGVTALFGIGLVTLPSSIFAMAYVDHLREERKALADQAAAAAAADPAGPTAK